MELNNYKKDEIWISQYSVNATEKSVCVCVPLSSRIKKIHGKEKKMIILILIK